MGKGSRSRAVHAEEKLNNPEKFNKKQHKPAPKWVAPLVALVLVLAVVVGVVFSILNVNGVMRRAKTSVTSENYTVTGTMMSVYFNGTLQAYNMQAYQYAYYYSMIYGSSSGKSFADWYQQMLGYNPNKDLDKQVKDKKSGSTWFDYFLSSTKSSVKSMLVYCEAAKAAGFTLTDEDYKTIDKEVESLKETASKKNMSLSSYISQNYGTGVKEKDFRAAYELQLLASSYQKKINNDHDDSITEDNINKYYDEHKTDFSVIRYFSYTADTKTDEMVEAAKKLAEASSYDEFKTMFTEFYKKESGNNDKSEEDLKKEVEKLLEDKTTKLAYGDRSTTDNYQQWMFSGEWKGDKDKNPGDVKVGKTFVVEGSKKCVIYHLITVPEKNTYLMDQDISYLPITVNPEITKPSTIEAFANSVLEQFEKGEKTADAMKSLAETINKDISDEAKQLKYTNIAKYSSSNKVKVTEVDDWISDAKVGEYKLIKAETSTKEKDANGKETTVKKDTYYLVLINKGTEIWHGGCHDAILDNLNEEWFNSMSKKYSVNFDDKVCGKYSNYL